jgi:hypothetical protein
MPNRMTAFHPLLPIADRIRMDRSRPRADARRGYQASCVDDPVEARAIWYVSRARQAKSSVPLPLRRAARKSVGPQSCRLGRAEHKPPNDPLDRQQVDGHDLKDVDRLSSHVSHLSRVSEVDEPIGRGHPLDRGLWHPQQDPREIAWRTRRIPAERRRAGPSGPVRCPPP